MKKRMIHTTVSKQKDLARMKLSKHQLLKFKNLTTLSFKTMEKIEITL